ncbi:MAG TPA: hypothetical protein VFR47_11220 [Anaerolineales bacterium]|nr:hypothetical protein [Anaerolineales bacterium]
MKQINPGGSSTIYPSTAPQKAAASLRAGSGGIYEVAKDANDTVTRTVTYYPAGGAMRIVDGTGNNLYYMVSTSSTRRLKDHLGSASVVTDATGTIIGEQRLRSVSLRGNTIYFRHDLYR